MSDGAPKVRLLQAILAAVAILFGVATIVAGARVLGGADPGYVVYRPLVLYNTVMGVAYVAAGIVAWRSVEGGRRLAVTIFALNVLMLGVVVYLYAAGRAVAVDSVRAMAFRTVVWLALFLGLGWLARRRRAAGG